MPHLDQQEIAQIVSPHFVKSSEIKSISKPLMIMGRNLHPLTEYVNRRVQEEVIKKTPPLFQEMGFPISLSYLPSKQGDWKACFCGANTRMGGETNNQKIYARVGHAMRRHGGTFSWSLLGGGPKPSLQEPTHTYSEAPGQGLFACPG